MKIAITGHRPNKLDSDYDFKTPLMKAIKADLQEILNKYINDDLEIQSHLTLITGMALGIDTLWAMLAIENNIPFIAAIPCANHSSKWVDKSVKVYNDILNNSLCTTHFVYSGEYNNSCMQNRNIWMTDNCDILIAVWDGTSGGTGNCVKYAKSKNKEIKLIDPNVIRTEIANKKYSDDDGYDQHTKLY